MKFAYPLIILATIATINAFSNSNYNINQKLFFTENKGQVIDDDNNLRPDILYTLNTGNGVKAYLTKKGVMYAYLSPDPSPKERGEHSDLITEENNLVQSNENENNLQENLLQGANTPLLRRGAGGEVMDMELIGSNENPEVIAEDVTESYTNYYLAHCPQGITHVHSYNKITYKNIYNNIDLVFYLNQENKLEYDFVARPGANIADIQFQYKGNVDIKITENGSLEITNPLGSITEKTPFTYLQNSKREVASQFQLNEGVVSFKVANFQSNETLVIDPTLEWGTYFGGNGNDYAYSVKSDGNGNVYIAGFTSSTSGIATSGVSQNTFSGGSDCFAAKFNSAGSLQWATYYGTLNNESFNSLTIDNSSNVFAGGYSGYGSTFIVKFNNSGILSASYTDTTQFHCNAITADNNGYIYLLSETTQDYYYKITLMKFSNDLKSKYWYVSYGGTSSGQIHGSGICVDASNNVYLGAYTNMASGITSSGAYQTSLSGSWDGLVMKFNSSGTLKWSTYTGDLGITNYHNATPRGICVDANANVYIAGEARDVNYQYYGFILKLNTNGKYQWNQLMNGDNDEFISGIASDNGSYLYIAGYTNSQNSFASATAYQNVYGGNYDAFIGKYNTSGSKQWVSYYGGTQKEEAECIAVNKGAVNTNIYATGFTNSSNAIAYNGYQNSKASYNDGFLIKFQETTTKASTAILAEKNETKENKQVDDQILSSIINIEKDQIKIYPNPSSGQFTIESANNSIISVYDMLGNKVAELVSNNNKIQVDLSSNKKGLYVIKIQNGDAQEMKKIILQ